MKCPIGFPQKTHGIKQLIQAIVLALKKLMDSN